MGYCKSFFMCSVRDIGLRKANCSLHFCIQQQQGFQCVRSRILLALHLSKKLAVAACTIISSSLYSEVMLENHKATSSLNTQVMCHARCKITDALASLQRLFCNSFTWSH